MSKTKTTPMIQQYLSIKAQYEDAILFYRMGDFYEMFFEDAKVASKALEITLTSRNKNDPDPVPMCGVPYKAAQTYIARLMEGGFKVAICDQVEDPADARGLVKREVVRVVTPGMIIENDMLEAKANNYLLALSPGADRHGLSHLDLSTGLFRVTETNDANKLVEEVQRIGPSEVLLPAEGKSDSLLMRVQGVLPPTSINWVSAARFSVSKGRQRLIGQFETLNLEGFGCQHMTSGLGAAGALLDYVNETQKQAVSHLHAIQTYSLDAHLILDRLSRQNLEIEKNIRSGTRQGTLISIIDKTRTAMGGRRLKQWLQYPLLSAAEIGLRLDAVEETLSKDDTRRSIATLLDSVYDLERLNSKIGMGHGNARDLIALATSLEVLPLIWQALEPLRSDLFRRRPHLDELSRLQRHISKAIRDDAPPTIQEGGMIRPGYNPELDDLLRIVRDGKGYLARLESSEKESTGINSLKVRYNKVFGYYLEIPRSQTALVPSHYVRKQTLVNAERYITDELKQFETEVLGAEDRRCALELSLFQGIRDLVRQQSRSIQQAADFLARLDCLVSLAEVADQNDYCRPRINTRGVIEINEGRHPVVEKMISGERFVPNTICLDNDANQVIIITGPNMAGKSTVLRQVALLVVMAQIGSFVPASSATIAVTDRIFTRVGALDNLTSGQSTFMVEMQETANILNNATADSLVIMDEIGRGTSTYDGLSIAWAVAEYLHDLGNSGVKTLFATHYHELIELAQKKVRVQNFNIAVKEWKDRIIFLRKLVPGGTNRSYGIQVARLAGVPDAVIERSKGILDRVENSAAGKGFDHLWTIAGKMKTPEPVQMDLFRSPDSILLQKIESIDIDRTTPLEALEILQSLQEKARSLSQ